MTHSSVDHLMHEDRAFPPFPNVSATAHIKSMEQYNEMYRRSIEESNTFWLEQAETLKWVKKPTVACKNEWNSAQNHIQHSWFKDGLLNVTENCLDRHISDRTAIIWQGDQDSETRTITYRELHKEVCRFANVLKSFGIKKGDRICIYMPMVPELVVAMLASARIGAIHSIVFGGFSSDSLAHRIQDSQCKLLVTANVSQRGGKEIPLKQIADAAMEKCPSIENAIVYKRNETACSMLQDRDHWYHEVMEDSSDNCPPEPMQAEDPLFILYTSGSTGKPKGVVHTQAGYLLWASLTHKYVFDLQPNDIYWCTADIGWVTGHSYIVYGPLANNATTLMFEGVPNYPDCGRFWQVVEKYKVTIFYTAPTAIRALIGAGESYPKKYDLSSLRILGTVGEPINPKAWMWYFDHIGNQHCPIADTWWQTETGGIMIAPLPGVATLKPGSAWRPFFGVEPIILGDGDKPCPKGTGGSLCIKKPWPGMMRTTWGDHQRFIDTYFKTYKNLYFTGDGCLVDKDGDYWLLGRIDDVVNVSGHRIGTAEVESALVSHERVAEAAVVPIPHEIKGQGLLAYVTLEQNSTQSDELRAELIQHVRKEIGPIATPDTLLFAPGLPKTRSGKIMRRILRKIAEGDVSNLGDTSTLAEPAVVDQIISIADKYRSTQLDR